MGLFNYPHRFHHRLSTKHDKAHSLTGSMKARLQLLKDTVSDPLDGKTLNLELEAFYKLYQRYVSDGPIAKGLAWDRVVPPGTHQLIEYSSLPDSHNQALLDKVAILKMNGGLGTTMGLAGAKCALTIKDDHTLLDLVVQQVDHLNVSFDSKIPLVLMTSFNTEKDTECILAKQQSTSFPVITFSQSRFPRISSETSLPLPSSVSDDTKHWYPPGHGDLYSSVFRSGLVDRLLAEGKEYLFVSNIDNLGATMDIKILQYMADSKTQFLMEVTEKTKSDVNAATLVSSRGRLMILEPSQVPSASAERFVSPRKYPNLNTNNIWINLKALKKQGEMMLDIIEDTKTVDGQPVIQLETSVGSAIKYFNKSRAVIVPRSRYLRLKTCADLLSIRSNVYTSIEGKLVPDETRIPSLPPLIKLSDQFNSIQDLERRFKTVPLMVELDHLTVTGDVSFGRNVVLKGTVIVVAAEGQHIDIPDGSVLDNCLISGDFRSIEV